MLIYDAAHDNVKSIINNRSSSPDTLGDERTLILQSAPALANLILWFSAQNSWKQHHVRSASIDKNTHHRLNDPQIQKYDHATFILWMTQRITTQARAEWMRWLTNTACKCHTTQMNTQELFITGISSWLI